MNLKVNIPALAQAEADLMSLSQRMRAISDEMAVARSMLLHAGETFQHEARLTGLKRDKLEREARQLSALADGLDQLIRLYADCEGQQELAAQINTAARPVRAELLRSGDNTAYHSTEQVTAAYEELIKPLLGLL